MGGMGDTVIGNFNPKKEILTIFPLNSANLENMSLFSVFFLFGDVSQNLIKTIFFQFKVITYYKHIYVQALHNIVYNGYKEGKKIVVVTGIESLVPAIARVCNKSGIR